VTGHLQTPGGTSLNNRARDAIPQSRPQVFGPRSPDATALHRSWSGPPGNGPSAEYAQERLPTSLLFWPETPSSTDTVFVRQYALDRLCPTGLTSPGIYYMVYGQKFPEVYR